MTQDSQLVCHTSSDHHQGYALVAVLAQIQSLWCCCAWQANAAKQQQAAAKALSKQHPLVAEACARSASRQDEGTGQAQPSAAHGKAGARAGRKRGRDTGSIARDKPARKRQPPPRYSACCPTTSPPPLSSHWQLSAMPRRF